MALVLPPLCCYINTHTAKADPGVVVGEGGGGVTGSQALPF